jgi:outer membrane protein OmpA-like peptidoglycan-associated protein
MKTSIRNVKTLVATAVASVLLAACSAALTRPEGADDARSKLTRLQSDPQLASRAPVAIKEAELAVRAAEKPQQDREEGEHLVFIADRKVEIASALAQSRLSVDQREMLSEQRENARLDSRTREVDRARSDAASARMDTAAANKQTDALQAQIEELNAKATDRGLVVTLGDLLFATGKSELKGGAARNLSKLAAFLDENKDRTVMIEGYTDNVGSEDYNMGLSQRRADSVKAYLVNAGIASSRLLSAGKGEASPVAGNDTASGRQQNRRVEVIIANASSVLR